MKFEELLPILDGKIEVRVADESSAYGYNAFVGMGHSLRQELDAAYLLDYVLERSVLSCYAAYDGEKYSIDSTHDLCPVYTETEPGEYEITGWKIR